ncbi:MAG: hypothetical protein IPN58_08085 [Anaerolineales bacterium]|nr:hypothetical protein [Anaerolineales bacterium]
MKFILFVKDETTFRFENLDFTIHGLSRSYIDYRLINNYPNVNGALNYALAVEKKVVELFKQGIEFDVVHASNWNEEAVAIIRENIYPTALMLVTPLSQIIQTEKWDTNNDLQPRLGLLLNTLPPLLTNQVLVGYFL